MKTYKSTVSLFSLKKNNTSFQKVKITCSKDAETFLRQFYFDDLVIYESFFILLLNRANITIGFAKISQGGVSGTSVDVRIIAKYCIESLADSVILCHNHPSGNILASNADKSLTIKLSDGLKFFDCNVVDHLILSESNYFSFADEGLL